jgi:hypothetical protein
MKNRYEKEYYDKLQEIRDAEDEFAQNVKRREKATQRRFRELARVLDIFAKSTLPPAVLETIWKTQLGKRPEWKSITKLLFPDSK